MTSTAAQAVETVKFHARQGCISSAGGCAGGSDILRAVPFIVEPPAGLTYCNKCFFRVLRAVKGKNLRAVRSVRLSHCFHCAGGLRLVCGLNPPYPPAPVGAHGCAHVRVASDVPTSYGWRKFRGEKP